MIKKILMITKSDEFFRSCNVCGKKWRGDNKNLPADKFGETHELQFGHKSERSVYSTSVCLCTDCLNEFSDALWQYLEEEGISGN